MRTSTTAIQGILVGAAAAFNLCPPAVHAAAPLQGRIEHTERMPSVPPGLQSGTHFDRPPVINSSNVWVRVPSWLSGTWAINEEHAVYKEDCRTGKVWVGSDPFVARSRFSYGKQTDRLGQVWHYLGTPYSSTTQFADYTELHEVASKTVEELQPDQVAVKTQFTVVRISKTTHEVINTVQQESITVYTRRSDDELLLHGSTKVFDQFGTPVRIEDNEALVHRLSPFRPVNRDSGKNLHEMFREFLIANGLTNLIAD